MSTSELPWSSRIGILCMSDFDKCFPDNLTPSCHYSACLSVLRNFNEQQWRHSLMYYVLYTLFFSLTQVSSSGRYVVLSLLNGCANLSRYDLQLCCTYYKLIWHKEVVVLVYIETITLVWDTISLTTTPFSAPHNTTKWIFCVSWWHYILPEITWAVFLGP